MLLTIPSIPTLSDGKFSVNENKATQDEAEISSYFKVLDVNSGKISDVNYRDYVIGAVMAEMPSSYHIEALKAQAVAAFTYALRQSENESISPTPELKGADFSNDSTHYQAYFSEAEAKEKLGASYSEAYNHISEAVDAVYGKYLEYDGEPIAAAYHSISNGTTESAKTVWGEDISYLQSTESGYDTSSPDYLHKEEFSADELKEKLLAFDSSIEFPDNPQEWIKINEISDSGTVTEVQIGNKKISGTQFRSALNLRSASFTTEYKDSKFVITTKGYGHGVGLSQYGANAMAFAGYTYDQILTHYYNGVEIKNIV